ncbi:hypothetical protein NBE98_15195 [Clostridium swellfunianum]|uniref:hypothetical protein n=1 Tax=Clostridium swellfunianum TaxID=1367462 RepID=UPI0020300785|nr:hypothetical protein [Clostridium swellfunianum]MCM0649712.1 hypothetical protein [Clostridium swellfunianum]
MFCKIRPYVGVQEIDFNMKREVVREKFNHQFTEFKKTPFSQNTTDAFEFCHVYYDNENLCEAIELFEPANVVFDNFTMTEQSYEKVRRFFESIDDSLDFNDAGFTSYKFGVGVFAPYALEEPKEPIESIIVFRKGYYD